MNMRDFSELVGMSPYTLRYYEKIGLLKNIQRNGSGHRTYSRKDVEWVGFIKRLKETGMSLEKIQEYAALRELGPQSLFKRQVILESHREKLKLHIEQQRNHLMALENKITLYNDGKVS